MDKFKGNNDSDGNQKKTVWNPFKKGYWNKDNLLGKNRTDKFSQNTLAKKKQEQERYIKETKATCSACGNVWFYGKQEVRENKSKELGNLGAGMSEIGTSMMCCTGCVPALFIPKQQIQEVKDLDKCNKCGAQL